MSSFAAFVKLTDIGRYWWVLILFVINSALGPLSSYFTGRLIDNLSNDEALFYENLLFVGIINGVGILTVFLTQYLPSYGGTFLISKLRQKIMSELTIKKATFMESQRSGTLSSVILSDTLALQNACTNLLPNMLQSGLMFAWSITVSGLVHWYFVLLLLGETILIVILQVVFAKKANREYPQRIAREKQFAGAQLEAIANWKIIRVFSLEEFTKNKVTTFLKNKQRIEKRIQLLLALQFSLIQILIAGAIIAVPLLGKYLIEEGIVKVGGLYTVYSSATAVLGSMKTFTASLNSLNTAQAVTKSILQSVQFGKAVEGFNNDKQLTPDGPWHFTIKNLSFRYPTVQELALKNISMNLPAKSLTALVGTSGSGKTTLLNILLQLYEPTDGSIELNGINLTNYSLGHYYKFVGLVPQEPTIFEGTMEDNVRYGEISATMTQVEEACQKANMHQFILALPEGYKTLVGDKGVRLSGGQKQRLAIARALLRQPKLLIFDEATSALDSHAERQIQESIDHISNLVTTIVVAHRLSTIRNAHQIYVLNDGIMVEEGTYESLIQSSGVFASMVNAQNLQNILSSTTVRERSYTA